MPTATPENIDPFAQLWFLQTDPMPGTLGVVRFTTPDSYGKITDVTEIRYRDDLEGFCAMELDVPEALLNGTDVSLMSGKSPDYFPDIAKFLVDGDDIEAGVF